MLAHWCCSGLLNKKDDVTVGIGLCDKYICFAFYVVFKVKQFGAFSWFDFMVIPISAGFFNLFLYT
jgi:hypothetical protein